MKSAIKTGTIGIAALAVMTSPLAMAEDSGWYMGANVGQSRTKIDDARNIANLLSQGLSTTSISDNNRDTGYKLFGGYQVNKNFALESGYFDLGQFGYTLATLPAGTMTGNAKFRGLNFDGVGILPITDQFSVFGRAGMHYTQTRASFTGTGAALNAGPVNANPSKNQFNYKLGAGLQYNFTEAVGMRLEAERYRVNDAISNKGDVDLYSIGLVYRFGVKKPSPPPPPPVVQREVTPEPVIVAAKETPVIAPPPPPPAPRNKAVFAADSSVDSLFDFGKSDVKPGGKEALNKFSADLKGANYEIITVTGHTDRIGSHAYNLKLSEKRAEAVKEYLVESANIPAEKIKANGVNSSEPVTKPGDCKGTIATKKLISCLAPDRRVEVEVAATRIAQ